MVSLKAVATVLNGDRSSNYPSKSDFLDYGEPFINAGHLRSGTIDYTNMDYISSEKLNSLSGARIQSGDVLLCLRGSLGKNAFVSKSGGAPASSIAVIRANATVMNPNFLAYVVSSSIFQKQIEIDNNGSSQPNLSASSVEDFLIPCPDAVEQRRIAEALSDMDELIASLEKLIAKKKAIKQGAMQELLTGKRRLPGFSGEWNAVELRKLGRFVGGGTPSTNNLDWWKGKTPWISSSDLEENQIRTIKMSRYITEEAISHSATNLCPAGAILVVSRVGVGKVAVAPVDLCTSQDFTNIIVDNCNPFFLAYTLSIVMKEKAATTQGTSIKGVTSDEIASIKVRIPSKLEQDAIVNALESIDQDIGSIEKQYLKSRQIKHGMMQQLLTGKIRV